MNSIGTQTIETERLVLRKFEFSDAPSSFKHWAGVEKIQTGYGEPTYDTIDKTSELIAEYIEKSIADDYYRWAIILKETDECIGMIAFFLVEKENELCEIEYCISAEYQNQGLMSEAAKAVIDFGFNEAKFNRIQISCRENNLPSKRVIEKCGFVYEGCLRHFFKRSDGFHDRLFFSILKEEYKKIKENN